MTPEQIIVILNNRLSYLSSQRQEAVARGDLDLVNAIDLDVVDTTNTIGVLQAAG